ncbi:MAG: hypothetical protein QOE30_407 [Mycobacterium sp.]|nr:hypothetical protein [Mycobacterium sp.]
MRFCPVDRGAGGLVAADAAPGTNRSAGATRTETRIGTRTFMWFSLELRLGGLRAEPRSGSTRRDARSRRAQERRVRSRTITAVPGDSRPFIQHAVPAAGAGCRILLLVFDGGAGGAAERPRRPSRPLPRSPISAVSG